MDLTYVPKYLTYEPRQKDGWPEGVDEAAKEWAVAQLSALLRKREYVYLDDAERELFGFMGPVVGSPPAFRDKPAWDYRYAVADRALRAAGGRQVWVQDSEV